MVAYRRVPKREKRLISSVFLNGWITLSLQMLKLRFRHYVGFWACHILLLSRPSVQTGYFLKRGLAHIREMLAERYFHLMQLGLFTRRWFGVILCRWNY
jgi:hypothetical protein